MGTISEFFGFSTREADQNNVEVRVDSEGEPSPAILPPARNVLGISPKEAYKIGTVYRSINIISTMISQMPLEVHKGEKKMAKTPALIKNPIDGKSQREFVQEVVWSLALYGNAYILTYGSPVSSVEVLDPDSVAVHKDPETGKTTYHCAGRQIASSRIKHLRFESLPGELKGIGPLTGAVGELKAAYLLDKFQQHWFNTDGVPTGVLATPGALNPQQSKAFVDAWNAFLKDNGKTAILPGGMKYEVIDAKPMEVQYREVAEANIRNVARIFGIPAANLLSSLEGNSMTYTNYIESNIQFLQNTLSNYMVAIEDALSELLPTSQRVEFDEEQLLRMSPEKLWAVRKTQYDVGYFDGAEQREMEGLPPLAKPEQKDPEQSQDEQKIESKEEKVKDNGNEKP